MVEKQILFCAPITGRRPSKTPFCILMKPYMYVGSRPGLSDTHLAKTAAGNNRPS